MNYDVIGHHGFGWPSNTPRFFQFLIVLLLCFLILQIVDLDIQ